MSTASGTTAQTRAFWTIFRRSARIPTQFFYESSWPESFLRRKEKQQVLAKRLDIHGLIGDNVLCLLLLQFNIQLRVVDADRQLVIHGFLLWNTKTMPLPTRITSAWRNSVKYAPLDKKCIHQSPNILRVIWIKTERILINDFLMSG